MASQTRLDQIRDLVNQWEQLVGFSVTIPDWMVSEMADATNYGGMTKIMSLFDVGRYMTIHIGDPKTGAYLWATDQAAAMPWARYGMSKTEYDSKLEGFDTAFRTLTGQAVPQDLIDQALAQHQGLMTGPQFETWLLAQDSIKNTYGWLRYGLDFNQFQSQKLQMRTQFGRELTDAEAVVQLQYFHQAQGPNVHASVQPTFTQTERKQAQTGVTGSVVR